MNERKCEKCGATMKETSREEAMADRHEDMTDGQMADYMAAELSGDRRDWSVLIVTYKCEKCGFELDVMYV